MRIGFVRTLFPSFTVIMFWSTGMRLAAIVFVQEINN